MDLQGELTQESHDPSTKLPNSPTAGLTFMSQENYTKYAALAALLYFHSACGTPY